MDTRASVDFWYDVVVGTDDEDSDFEGFTEDVSTQLMLKPVKVILISTLRQWKTELMPKIVPH